MINKLSPLNHPNQQIKLRIHNWQFTIINSQLSIHNYQFTIKNHHPCRIMSLQLIIIVELNLIKTKDDDFYLIDSLWLTRKF